MYESWPKRSNISGLKLLTLHVGKFPCFSCLHTFQNYFQKTIRVSNGSDPDQGTYVLCVLIWFQSVCKGYQQTSKVAASKEQVKLPTVTLVKNPTAVFDLPLHIVLS